MKETEQLKKLMEAIDSPYAQVDEAVRFDTASGMLKELLSDIAEIHLEAESEDPEGVITELLHDLILKYRGAYVA